MFPTISTLVLNPCLETHFGKVIIFFKDRNKTGVGGVCLSMQRKRVICMNEPERHGYVVL